MRALFLTVVVGLCTGQSAGTQSVQPLDAHFQDLIGKTVSARVVRVTDGDTLEILVAGERRAIAIRLLGVDAPEKNESFHARALAATRVLAFDRQVLVFPRNVERSGRLVARVKVDGTDVGSELVRRGLACHDTDYSDDRTLAKLESAAKAQGLGVWARGGQKPRCVARKEGALKSAGFRGNTSSKIYHSAGCRNFACKNCVAVFATEADAKEAGYRRASDCPTR